MRLPHMYATGSFELKSPWSVSADTEYVVTGIVSFASALEQGIDILKDVYEANGLSDNEFSKDTEQGASIVVLSSVGEETVYVPSTYILKFPNNANTRYRHTILSVSLGALPDNFGLEDIKTSIDQLVNDKVGVDSDVVVHYAPTTGSLTPSQHSAAEASRVQKVKNSKTFRALYLEKQEELDDALDRIKVLEQMVVQLNDQVNPTT